MTDLEIEREALGNVIKKIRGTMAVSLFSDKIGCHKSFIYRLESGLSNCELGFLTRMGNAMDISLVEITEMYMEEIDIIKIKIKS